MFDYTINIPTLLAALLPVIGFIVYLIRMEGRVTAAETLAKGIAVDVKDLDLQVQAAHALTSIQEKSFMEYRVEAAEKFVTHAAVNARSQVRDGG